jgi:zinc/manganese transport system ATP-binding protein
VPDPFIEARKLTIRYGNTAAIANLSLRAQAGEMLAICGPNGAGKSTLLKCLAGLIPPNEGEIYGMAGRRVAYLAQAHQIDRSFPITVMDMVSMGIWHQTGAMRGLSRVQYATCLSALHSVGLEAHHRDPISTLSGGQFQRALFARTVLQDAEVVLLDEPLQGIDLRAAAGLLDQMRNMQLQGKIIITVLHDHQLALTHFPRVVLLCGQIIAAGNPLDVLSDDNIANAYRCAHLPRQHALRLGSHDHIPTHQPRLAST